MENKTIHLWQYESIYHLSELDSDLETTNWRIEHNHFFNRFDVYQENNIQGTETGFKGSSYGIDRLKEYFNNSLDEIIESIPQVDIEGLTNTL